MNKNEGKAIAKGIAYSPYKLRPIINVIRNKSLKYALNWLNVYRNRKSEPVRKVIESAFANMKNDGCLISEDEIFINEIRVDQGIIRKYFIPGAQGKASFQRRRFCHIFVSMTSKDNIKKNKTLKGAQNGTKG